jgi:hypothetical protein
MKHKQLFALFALIAAFVAIHADAKEKPSEATVIASYPHGAFLENLSIDPARRLLFTSYIDRTLMMWCGRGAPSILAELDVHPVGVLARNKDIIVSAHGTSFMDGPVFTASNQLLVLDRNGVVKKRVAAPDALFLNGMVEIAPDTILIADSLAGKIWRFDPANAAIDIWLADPLLAPDPAKPSQRPAANGLKLENGWLYVSNSARGAMYRVALSGDSPSGPLEHYAATGPVDDFTFLADGTIAAATHGNKLVRIARDGTVTDILSDGCDGCTSVVRYGPRSDLIILTTGNLLEGGTAPARVLRIPSPAR